MAYVYWFFIYAVQAFKTVLRPKENKCSFQWNLIVWNNSWQNFFYKEAILNMLCGPYCVTWVCCCSARISTNHIQMNTNWKGHAPVELYKRKQLVGCNLVTLDLEQWYPVEFPAMMKMHLCCSVWEPLSHMWLKKRE